MVVPTFWLAALLLLLRYARPIRSTKLPHLLEQQFRAVKVGAVPRDKANGTSPGPMSVSTADLVHALSMMHGASPESSEQASALFLLELYQELQNGKDLSVASGNGRRDPAIKHANTVRSFTAKGRFYRLNISQWYRHHHLYLNKKPKKPERIQINTAHTQPASTRTQCAASPPKVGFVITK